MAKKPFSIRLPEPTIRRYRALVMTLDTSSEELFTNMIREKEKSLSAHQLSAYESLLMAWREND